MPSTSDPNQYAWLYNLKISCWAKKIPTNYNIQVYAGFSYTLPYHDHMETLVSPDFFDNNEWKKINVTIQTYNYRYTNSGIFSIYARPSNYNSTGMSGMEVSRLPCIALADFHLSLEPVSIIHNEDLTSMQLYNTGNYELSDIQFKRINRVDGYVRKNY